MSNEPSRFDHEDPAQSIDPSTDTTEDSVTYEDVPSVGAEAAAQDDSPSSAEGESWGTDVDADPAEVYIDLCDDLAPADESDDLVEVGMDGEVSESEGARTLVVEHLAPSLPHKTIVAAFGVTVAVFASALFVPGIFTSSPEPVGVSSAEVAGGAGIAEEDKAPGVAEAMKSVYRIDAGSNTGSSFLVNETTLATNAHVATADVGEKVRVTTPNGHSFDGKVLMRDESVDIALVGVPKQDVKPLSLLSVREQEVGQGAYLAGYPLSLDLTLTTGVVSAVDTVTNLRESSGQHSLLQVDAAVNPGSSGGPVLDREGRVMGIATSRPDSVGSRSVQGIAFAVPANDLSIAINQYNEHGDVSYGYLGVSYESQKNAIRSVTPNTPADAAGLKRGDVIVSINGYETPDYTAVSRHMHVYRPGDQVKLQIKRGKDVKDQRVVLGEPR